ncbi:lasso peptide biosynthesis PqqD family chaperone [Streptomyces sp. B6B3]|uniref:lasso peptide biosynthesis PqqD family chaperone n=1 Tax=Streptomyces sp. B6B3 TaxID=3153570 RepID=UPI00325E5015
MTLLLRNDVSVAHTDHGTVLLDGATGRYWQLNATASEILRHLVDGTDHDALATRLSGTYRIPREKAAEDIAALITRLRTARLLAEDPA